VTRQSAATGAKSNADDCPVRARNRGLTRRENALVERRRQRRAQAIASRASFVSSCGHCTVEINAISPPAGTRRRADDVLRNARRRFHGIAQKLNTGLLVLRKKEREATWLNNCRK